MKSTCCHCRQPRWVHARGLCQRCYQCPRTRALYPNRRAGYRPWTAGEVRTLAGFRSQLLPLSLAECAAKLKRSRASVAQQLFRSRLTVVPHFPRGRVRPIVRRLVRDGLTDDRIAAVIGRTKRTVRMHRTALGLPAVRHRKANPMGGRAKRKQPPPECWACGKLCPSGTHIAFAGWARREIRIGGQRLLEVYCPGCFARWGWPPPAKESA